MHPFRFLASINDNSRFNELTVVARKAEAVGFSTFVLNANLRHPAVLAQELATLDALSGGRLDIGLGAGWNKTEQDAIGVPFESAGVRIERLAEASVLARGRHPRTRRSSICGT